MPRVYQPAGSSVWWSDLQFPSHPKADKSGRLRIPLDTDKSFAQKALGRLLESRDAAKHGRQGADQEWSIFRDRFIGEIKNRETRRHYERAAAFVDLQMVSGLTPEYLSGLRAQWIKDGRGLYVRNKDLQCLKAMARKACAWKIVGEQDWGTVRREKEPRGRLLWYTVSELRRLIRACAGNWRTIVMLGARAGLRRAEIHWLDWTDVDFERRRIHVAPKPGWNPKDHERRWVPMSKDVAAYLKRLPKKSPYVLEEGGRRPTLGSMTVYFSRLVRKAGLKGSIHTLRHTFGAHMASAGVPLFTLSKIMGHSSVEVTEIYAHLAPSPQQSAVDHLPAL